MCKIKKAGGTGPPVMDPGKLYVNPGQDEQMEIEGYRLNRVKNCVVWVFIFLTVGLLRLVFYWLPHYMVFCTHDKCSLGNAETVALRDQYNQYFIALVLTCTRDGTRVKVLTPGPVVTFKNRNPSMRTPLITDSKQSIPGESEAEAPIESYVFSGSAELIRFFVSKKVKYVWDDEKEEFFKLRGLEQNTPCSYFHECKGLSYMEQLRRRVTYYGSNKIEVHVTPIITLLFKEGLSPFYVFQLFSVCVWFAEEYEIYAACIIFISTVSLITTIYQNRSMQRALRNTISCSTIVSVCRGGNEFEEISSEDLAPGDIIEVPRHGCVMQCDAALITGNCIVNESMLTGESVPVTKTPLPNPKLSHQPDKVFDMKEHSKHTLFCGTNVIQTRYYGNQRVKAVVLRTGFSTSKGDLVRAIMYPKPVDFKFNRDTYLFILILAGIAFLGFIYTVVLMVGAGDEASDIVIKTLDLITITVPPALPAALTVGIVFAQRRLRIGKIYCISPRSINICGTINAVCFDKTGTLTEDGLDMKGVVPSYNGKFEEEITNMKEVSSGPTLHTMATCHSLTIIDGEISGDPLDRIMFDSIGWDLEEPGHEEERFDMMVPTIVRPKTPDIICSTYASGEKPLTIEIGVVRQFTFSSSLQRMSVITRVLGASNFEVYCKGSPEMIASLSKRETIPFDFNETLIRYTQHGYRVIGLAWKPLPSKINYVKVQRIPREQVEKELVFLGLLVMENRLKPETLPVINQLREANIKTIMITGDNMLTALSVARECDMLDPTDKIIMVQAHAVNGEEPARLEFVYADDKDSKVEEVTQKAAFEGSLTIQIDEDNQRFHFAVSGKSWGIIRHNFPDVLEKIAVKGIVFARMSPEQKAQLVEVLQELGYYVGMCGDGANDCGALKAAHTGISLSEAEASVASPFTSKHPNIKCVPKVIREGRCALVTSFGIFKYMACYSLTQFVSVLLLYWIGANLTDFEFLYIDLFLLTSLSITFGYTGPYDELSRELPPISLTSPSPVLSLFVQMSIIIGVQAWCYMDVQTQPWFTPYVKNENDDYTSYENTAVFYISAYQYIALAISFSKGAPFRKSIFSNFFFLGNLAACLALTLWLTIYPSKGLEEFLELKPPPSIVYRLTFVGIAAANILLSVIIETYLVDSTFIRYKCQRLLERCLPRSQHKYATIEKEITETPDWPPVTPSASSFEKAFHFNLSLESPKLKNRLSGIGDDDSLGLDSDSVHEKTFKDTVHQYSPATSPLPLTHKADKLPLLQSLSTSDDGSVKNEIMETEADVLPLQVETYGLDFDYDVTTKTNVSNHLEITPL